MMIKNLTNKQRIWELEQKAKFQIQQELLLIQRIEELEKEVKRLWEVLDEVSIQARRGESAWNRQQPLGGIKFRNVPISPEFPDMGHFQEIDTEPEKGLRDRIK